MGGRRLAGSVGPSSLPHEPNGGPFRTQFTSHLFYRRPEEARSKNGHSKKGPKKSKKVILYKLAYVFTRQNANEGKRPDDFFALVFEPIKGVEGFFSHRKHVRLSTHPR